jgi:Glycosyl hydrolase family 71
LDREGVMMARILPSGLIVAVQKVKSNLVIGLVLLLPFLGMRDRAAVAGALPDASGHPKEIFAHFMGCYPIARTSISTDALRTYEAQLRPDGPHQLERVGGFWRNFPLTPPDFKPSLEDSVDLEMRRAMRIGLNGFAIDTLAGRQTALDTLDAMFKVAEAKHYPFEITFCLDNPVLNLDAVRHLIKNHGQSPNLARRDGKVLLLGYRSNRWGLRLHPELSSKDWTEPEGFDAYCDAAKELEKIAGQPLYIQFCLNGFVPNQTDIVPTGISLDPGFWQSAMTGLSKSYGAVTAFFWGGKNYDEAAKAARTAGMDWGEPMWVQYQEVMWDTFRLKDGSDLLRERWNHAIANDATLIQIATWNDYTEATNVAPSQQTGYAFYDLMGWMIRRWKEGKMPEPDHDRIYLFYPPYPKGSRVFPFHDFAPEIGGNLEVLTILTKPATVVMPGRDAQWDAPAGLFVRKLPPTAGPVVAELTRGGQTVLSLTAREPITDRPFRAQHSFVGYSTEDARLWKEDFPDNTASPPAYYADDVGNGLPNWFRMYYFGKLGDFTSGKSVAPDAIAGRGGITNLQAYLDQVNPLHPEADPPPGTNWDLLQNPITTKDFTGVSTNPDIDHDGREVWRYVGSHAGDKWELLWDCEPVAAPMGKVVTVTHSRASRNALAVEPEQPAASVSYRWTRPDLQSSAWTRDVTLQPASDEAVGVEFVSYADGVYSVSIGLSASASLRSESFQLGLSGPGGTLLWNTKMDAEHPVLEETCEFSLKKGQVLRLTAGPTSHSGSVFPRITKFQVELKKSG